MQWKKHMLVCVVMAMVLVSHMAFAQMHVDPDTGITIKDGYDISVFTQLSNGLDVYHMAYGKGGSFGNDLYATTAGGDVYRIDSAGQANLFATLPTNVCGIDFPNAGSGFGDYMYVGSADGYYGGNKTIYSVNSSGVPSVFFDGSGFLGGTTNALKFAPAGSPYGNYLFTQDDSPDQIYRITSAATKTTFSSGIPLAVDYMFDTYGQFGNQLIVSNIEKSEHGSHYNTLYKVATDGTKTTLLGDEFHMGGGDITDPSSAFGGKMFVVENYWPSQPTDMYAVGPDGSHELFAQNFQFGDFSDVVYGPDSALYVGDDTGTIYRIAPEPPMVHYIFEETSSGNWEVSVEVADEDSAGLSAYSLWVYNTDPALVSYTENTLCDAATLEGFLPPNLVQGDVGGDFNAGNFQSAGPFALTDIGIAPVSQGAVDLGVPALLGILTTPAGLGEDDFAALNAGLLNATNDGYIAGVTVSYDVYPIPEPATLGLLLIGGLILVRKKGIITKKSIILVVALISSVLAISTNASAREAQPMPSTPKMFISDSGYGSLIEVNPSTFALGSFHFGLGTGALEVSPLNELCQADYDNIWLIKPDWTRHRWAGHDNDGQYTVVDTESLYLSRASEGLDYQVDLNNDDYLSEFDYGGERVVIVQTNVSGFTFKGSDYSQVYFVQDTTNTLFTAPTTASAPSQFITSNNDLDGLFSMTYRDGYFYGLNPHQDNILRIAEDGSSMSFIMSDSPLSEPRQMTWGLDGLLYVADSGADNVFRVNPITGDWSAVFAAGTLSNPVGLAFVPEPATLSLLLIGGMALLRRRK